MLHEILTLHGNSNFKDRKIMGKDDGILKFQDTLLRFASSELTAHAAHLIGLAVLLFSYLSFIVSSEYFPRIYFALPRNTTEFFSKATIDYFVIFLIFWVLNTGLFFALNRLIYYGKYAHTIMTHEKKAKNLKEFVNEIAKTTDKGKIFGLYPRSWFKHGLSITSKGFWFSISVEFLISILLFYVFFAK